MEIIKPGNKPEDQTMTGKCYHCGCIFRCKQSECQWLEDRPGDGNWAVHCPTCSGWAYPRRERSKDQS